VKLNVLRAVNMQRHKDCALFIGEDFYSEQRPTGAIGMLLIDLTTVVARAMRTQMKGHQSRWPRDSSEAGKTQCQDCRAHARRECGSEFQVLGPVAQKDLNGGTAKVG